MRAAAPPAAPPAAAPSGQPPRSAGAVPCSAELRRALVGRQINHPPHPLLPQHIDTRPPTKQAPKQPRFLPPTHPCRPRIGSHGRGTTRPPMRHITWKRARRACRCCWRARAGAWVGVAGGGQHPQRAGAVAVCACLCPRGGQVAGPCALHACVCRCSMRPFMMDTLPSQLFSPSVPQSSLGSLVQPSLLSWHAARLRNLTQPNPTQLNQPPHRVAARRRPSSLPRWCWRR